MRIFARILLPLSLYIALLFPLSASEYEQWLQQQTAEYDSYQDRQDKAFSSFLTKEWRNYQLSQGAVRDDNPKPVAMPVAPPPPQPSDPELKQVPGQTLVMPTVEVKKIPRPSQVIKPAIPNTVLPTQNRKGSSLHFDFYGTPISLRYDKKIVTELDRKPSNRAVSQFWDNLSRAENVGLLEQLAQYRQALNLNDWGYAMFLHKTGYELFRKRENEARLFVWFILSKEGYDARVGFSGQRVILMLPTDNEVFGLPFFTYSGKKYYVTNFDRSSSPVKNIYSYDGRYPDAERSLSLAVTQLPNIKKEPVKRKLSFSFAGKTHTIEIIYDRNIVDYFRAYPVTELDIYFTAAVSDQLAYTLLTSLRSVIERKPEEEAVNTLLRFVQTAFAYKTDGDQFGREKYFFPEELFHYNYSDCEDRSVLFAFLVNSLLGLDVIALDYPGHVATAVHFNGPTKGVSVNYQGKRFTVTDPTYVNANAGSVMPNFRSTTPDIIPITF